ncbi:hypothetical protein [Halocatena halophila]|uniref:hypothetical protein n=1 Tax=Halocatena halophila TaxID=2814576 RepID=UPI002ED0395F
MNLKHALENGVERQLRNLYIYVPAILEDVDEQGLGTVVKKDDKDVMADKVPIFSLYSGDGYGEKHALHPPEEGFMLCCKYPTPDVMSQQGIVEEISHSRHYSFQDGHFIPGPRFHNFEQGLDTPIDAYHYRHKSGAEQYISPDGDMQFTHPSGHEVDISSGNVSVTFSRSDGDNTSITVSESVIGIDAPDKFNDHATDPRTQIRATESGRAHIDGIVSVGDADAHREDRTTETTDPDDPRTYEEVNEPAEPIADPTDDAETAYDNPSTVEATGAIDHGLFEHRRAVVERREVDPDPAINDPTDPAYIELPDSMRSASKLPVGYQYIETTAGELRMIGMDGTTPITITTL